MNKERRTDRAERAVPGSLAGRVSAWAKESLAARAIAVAGGMVLLAVLGGSALAGSAKGVGSALNAAGGSPAAEPTPPTRVDLPSAAVDAGEIAIEIARGAPDPGVHANVAPATATTPAKARASPEDPVDLNTATADDLRRLPGVGAKRAEAILALRARLPGGRFHQIEDLLKVKGVGRAMLKRLHPLVRLPAS